MGSDNYRDLVYEVVKSFEPYISDEQSLANLRVDFLDVEEAYVWLQGVLLEFMSKKTTEDEKMTFLIDLELRFIDHLDFHLNSMRHEVGKILDTLGNEE